MYGGECSHPVALAEIHMRKFRSKVLYGKGGWSVTRRGVVCNEDAYLHSFVPFHIELLWFVPQKELKKPVTF